MNNINNMENIDIMYCNDWIEQLVTDRHREFWNEVFSIYNDVVKDLQLTDNIAFYMSDSLQDKTLGVYDYTSFGHIIHINVCTLTAIGEIDKAMETVAHELRHAWQQEEDWVFNMDIPYEERFHERDARLYSGKIVSKLYRSKIWASKYGAAGLDTDGDLTEDALSVLYI